MKYEDVFWAAGMISTRRIQVVRRLSRYVNDCAIRVLPIFEQRRPQDHRPREAISATYQFSLGRISEDVWLKAVQAAMTAWAEWAAPAVWTTGFVWIAGHRFSRASLVRVNGYRWAKWTDWAEWAAWMAHAAKEAWVAEHEEDRWKREQDFEGWQYDRLVLWLGTKPPRPLRLAEPLMAPCEPDTFETVRSVASLELGWDSVVVLPGNIERIDSVTLYRNAALSVPAGVKSIGLISMDDHPTLKLPDGLEAVERIELGYNDTFLKLPKTVTAIGRVELALSARLTAQGAARIEEIQLNLYSRLRIPRDCVVEGPIVIQQGEYAKEMGKIVLLKPIKR
jgi:hypothetical protein